MTKYLLILLVAIFAVFLFGCVSYQCETKSKRIINESITIEPCKSYTSLSYPNCDRDAYYYRTCYMEYEIECGNVTSVMQRNYTIHGDQKCK